MKFGYSTFLKVEKILTAAVRCAVSSATGRSHLDASRHRPPPLGFTAAGPKRKGCGHGEGGSVIWMDGAGDLRSVPVGVMTGPSQVYLEEGKCAI